MEINKIKSVNRRIMATIIVMMMITVGFNVITEKIPELQGYDVPTVRADSFDPPTDKFVLIGYVAESNIGLYEGNWAMLFYNDNENKLRLIWNIDDRGLTDFPDLSWAGISFRVYYSSGDHENDRVDDAKIIHDYETTCAPNTWETHGQRTWPNIHISWGNAVYWEIWGVVGGNHFTPNEQATFDWVAVIESVAVGVIVGLIVGGPVGVIVGAVAGLAFGAYKIWQKSWLIDQGAWDKYGYILAKDKMRLSKDSSLTLEVNYKSTGTQSATNNKDTYNTFEQARGRPYDVETYEIQITGKRISKIQVTFDVDECKIYGVAFEGGDESYWYTYGFSTGIYEVDLTSFNPQNIFTHYKEDRYNNGVPVLTFRILPIVDFEVYDNIVGEDPEILEQSWNTEAKAYSLNWKSSPHSKTQGATMYVRFDFTPLWGPGTSVLVIIAIASGDSKITIEGKIYKIIKAIIDSIDIQPPDGKYWAMYETIWDTTTRAPIILPKLPEPAFEPVVPEPNCEPAIDPNFGIPGNFEIRIAPEDWDDSVTIDTENINIPDPGVEAAIDIMFEFPDTTTVVTFEDAFSSEPTISINSEDRSAIIIPGGDSEGQIVRVNDPDEVATIGVHGGTTYTKTAVNIYEPDDTVFVDIAARTETAVTVLQPGSQPDAPTDSQIMVTADVGPSLTTDVDFYSSLAMNPGVKIADGTLTTTPSATFTTYTDMSSLALQISKDDDAPSLDLVEIGAETPLIDIALERHGSHLKPLYWIDKSTWRYDYEDYIPSNPPNPEDLTTTFAFSGYFDYPMFNSLYWGLTNTGTEEDTINLEVGNVPTGWTATLKDISGLPVSSVILAPDATVQLYLEVAAPQITQPWEIIYIWVKSTSSADPTQWDYAVFKIVIVNEINTIWWPVVEPNNPYYSYLTLDIIFPSWAGGDEFVYLCVPKIARIRSSSLDIIGDSYQGVYPTDANIDVGIDGNSEWEYMGSLKTITSTDDFGDVNYALSNAIQEYIDTHPPDDSEGNVYVPIKVSSESKGMLTLTDIEIIYNEYIH